MGEYIPPIPLDIDGEFCDFGDFHPGFLSILFNEARNQFWRDFYTREL